MAGSADDPDQGMECHWVSSLETDHCLIRAYYSALRLNLNSASQSVSMDPSCQSARVARHQGLARMNQLHQQWSVGFPGKPCLQCESQLDPTGPSSNDDDPVG